MYRLEKNAFDEDYLAELRASLLGSRYLGKSPLGEEFVNTLGFSIVFRRNRMPDVLAHFGYLRRYLEMVVFGSSNAFYVNPVIMNSSSRVDAHVDCRLLEKENARIVPNLVSILYVCSEMNGSGGELCFQPGSETERAFAPKTGDLLHFLGDLVHSVRELPDGARTRISLVCEQYNLAEPMLSAFPEFAILRDHDLAPRVSGVA